MTKRKTKLVCVGWGIWEYDQNRHWSSYYGQTGWGKRQRAILAYDNHFGEGEYGRRRRKGLAIAKKLWIEVKHDKR